MNQAKQELQQLESTIKEIQSQKHALSNQVHQDQERVSKLKVNLQSCLVKQNGVVESFEEQVREKLVEEATKVAQAELAEKQKEAEQLALLESMKTTRLKLIQKQN